MPPFAFPRLEKRAPPVPEGRPFGLGASLFAMGAGMPAVLGGDVVENLPIDGRPGFAKEFGGLGQRPSLGDGGLEVDPVVVPYSLFLFHVSFSFLRWAAGREL